MSSDESYCKSIESETCGNRLSFEEKLREEIDTAKKEGKPIILLGPPLFRENYRYKKGYLRRNHKQGAILRNRDK